MTGQSVNPEQPRGRGATRLELGRKSNEEPNLAPTYTETGFWKTSIEGDKKVALWAGGTLRKCGQIGLFQPYGPETSSDLKGGGSSIRPITTK
jgi:hypothetical protein